MGTILGMIFGASSLYLVLKVGLTVSASIPVAVIAITLFRLTHKLGGKDSSILENSIAQTAGSAGESLAFGLGVTMPAILILGFDLEIYRVMLVAVLGGLLGILLMIPMRRTMIVEKHHELKYPEGTACAEVLKAAANDESRAAAGESSNPNAQADARRRAQIIFGGFFIGLIYKVLNIALKGWKDTVDFVFSAPLKGGSVGSEISPELLGVGYIIGPRIAAIMAAGGVMSYMLLIPLIKFFGDGLLTPLAPATKLISEMSPNEIRGAYVLYIGAGAVATGGLISLGRAMPLIWRSLSAGLSGFGRSNAKPSFAQEEVTSTDRSIHMKWVIIGSLAIVAIITVATPLHMNLLGRAVDTRFWFLICDSFFAADRTNWPIFKPNFWYDCRDTTVHLLNLFTHGLGRWTVLCHSAFRWCHRMYRIECGGMYFTRSQNRVFGWVDTEIPTVRHLDRRFLLCTSTRADSIETERSEYSLCTDCTSCARPTH